MAVVNGATWRAWVSPLVAITFLAVSGTGILMLSHVRGGNVRGLHESTGILFALSGLVHLALNWRAFTACFRRRTALVTVAVATAACLIVLLLPGHESARDRDHSGRGFRQGVSAGEFHP